MAKYKNLTVLLIFSVLLFLSFCDENPTSPNNETVGTLIDIDGNVYKTVRIGDQWWMAENLKVTHYRNGDTIAYANNSDKWISFNEIKKGAYCSYNHQDINVDTYGRLYNWYVINDERKIAPTGWRVPTDADWQILVDYYDGDAYAGGYLKEIGIDHWEDPNIINGETNEFDALPGGFCNSFGVFGGIKTTVYFWSSTEYDSIIVSWNRYIRSGVTDIVRSTAYRTNGYSIRLIKN